MSASEKASSTVPLNWKEAGLPIAEHHSGLI